MLDIQTYIFVTFFVYVLQQSFEPEVLAETM